MGVAEEGALKPISFWFLRHGQTDWNARDLAQGRVDIPLNARGLAQAEAAAKMLQGRGIASITASPIPRARITAEIAAKALGLPVVIDDDLQEVAYGAQEGEPMTEWFTQWVGEQFTPEGGESFIALRTRAVRAVNRALALPSLVLIVGHGGFFRALRSAMGLDPHMRAPNAIPMLCCPPRAGERSWRLEIAT